jgi:hypothetical protein
MLFTVKEDLTLMRELKLSPRQLVLIKMLVRNPSMDEREWKLSSYAMSNEFQALSPLSADELADLISREIIIDLNTSSDKIYYDCYEINPRYQYKFTLAVIGMPSELAEAYPREGHIQDGRTFPARDAGANEIAEEYMKAIGKDEKAHERVMQDLEWAKANKKIGVGLKKFVNTKYWLYIRELKKKVNPKTIDNARLG